jgi:hypothetical protein
MHLAMPIFMMRLFRAGRLDPAEAPELYRLMAFLTQRAGLEQILALTRRDSATADMDLSTQDIRRLLAHNPYRPRWHRNGMWY